MIGRSGERGSGISVLAARHDDDDDDDLFSMRKQYTTNYHSSTLSIVYNTAINFDFL